MGFDEILLEEEQKGLLVQLVEAARSVARSDRQKFLMSESTEGAALLHPGLPGNLEVYSGDMEALADVGLLRRSNGSRGNSLFDVTPSGFKYFGYLKQVVEDPIARVETATRAFLEADVFRHRYPMAYEKWQQAEKRLWPSDSERELTTIGHLCREAVQEFAEELLRHHEVAASSEKSHTVARIKTVLEAAKSDVGVTKLAFLEALLAYWGTINDLIQRQEHGGQKEGEPLRWEDARLVVFQTLLVMYEVDRAVSV